MRENKKILIVCNTAYQIMVATQLRHFFFKTDEVHLLVSNHMNNSEAIAENVKQTHFFDNVIYVQNKKLVVKQGSKFRAIRRTTNRIKETILNLKIIKHLVKTNGYYDELCVSNISIFTILLLHRLKRKNVRLSIFEDGFSTYCRSFKNSDRASTIHRLLNKNGMLGDAERLFLFNPQLLEWNFGGKVIALPKFSRENNEIKAQLNQTFQLSNIKDDYSTVKYLFMEESFFADGFKVNDVELVQKIAEKTNINDVCVKLHPRNSINRFEPLGIKTNINFDIPWELIILNQDIEKITLLTISSSSALTPYLIFDLPVKSISMLNLLDEKPGEMQGELGVFMQKIYRLYPDVFFAPKTSDEFFKLL